MKNYNIIYSEDEVLKFLRYIRMVNGTLVSDINSKFMVMMAARNKYLTDIDKLKYKLSKTCVMDRKTVDISNLKLATKTIEKYEIKKGLYTDNDGIGLPESCLTCYFMLNPINPIKGALSFIEEYNKLTSTMVLNLLNNNNVDSLLRKISNPRHALLSHMQKTPAYKLFVDIDFDIDKSEIHLLDTFIEFLNKEEIVYMIIRTHGGFHVCIPKNSLGKTNIYNKIQELHKQSKKEICINKNGMVPLPGTLQGGKEVKIINMI